ncbi:hypothetical protein [Bacteroides sp.]|uniref:hypothetical protein n=1 Tax=Bacteroides sp. TaxID=29523 RepID=UPI00260CC56D|nr:hypothetical protein [Bacteroides sp.]MDD3039698.1 hypothetical protein [Bacteroides sp.]
MNRETKRKILNGKISEAELTAILDLEIKKAISMTVHRYSVVLALCLHDKLGFGEQRGQRFMKQVKEIFDAVNEGYVDFAEIEETVNKELGIDFRYK